MASTANTPTQLISKTKDKIIIASGKVVGSYQMTKFL